VRILTEGQSLLVWRGVLSLACAFAFFMRTYLCVREVFPVAFIAGYASSGLVDDYVVRPCAEVGPPRVCSIPSVRLDGGRPLHGDVHRQG